MAYQAGFMSATNHNEIDRIQQDIVDEFAMLGDDWTERYQYIIDCGKSLPDLPAEEKIPENILHGCQSQVWLLAATDGERMSYRANSDALIVSGLIALLLRIYSGRPINEITASEPWFVDQIGLAEHLSPTRSNGLAAMLAAIRVHAVKAQQTDQSAAPIDASNAISKD
jgi:cysteine desulfuration protein SufE